MQKNEIVSRMAETKVMAVVRIDSLEEAIKITEGCLESGVDVMKISYTSKDASAYIKYIAANYKDMLVGAGTVLDPETAKIAI